MSTGEHGKPNASDPLAEAAAGTEPTRGTGPQDTPPTWPAAGIWDGDGCEDEAANEPPPVAAAPPAATGMSGVDEDARATFVPRDSKGLSDIWGDDFKDVSPRMTLKGGRATRRPASPPPPAAPPPASSAASLTGYELLKVLGEGGVGVVYQAIQKSIDREIAVKMIKPAVGRDARERTKFISEAMVTGELDHPNIVPIHDLGTTADGQPYYAMKLVRGRRWSETIRQNSLADNLRILLDVCDAVSFAHSKGVIHRDLKPDNVMVGEFGEVQLMDWGLGASVASDGKAPLTESQAAGGTPAYMAPEMVTGEDVPVGYHSDIYLLGAILFECVAGTPPHPGTHVLEVLEHAMNNVIVPVEQGGVLVDIALRAMATEPAERYASVKEFRQAVLDYQAHAESIAACEHASLDLHQARERSDYELFAQALYGFRHALELWPDNADAQTGVTTTELQYARCAYEKGDYDLGASLLDAQFAEHQELAAEIAEAQRRRASARRRLRVARLTAIGLTAAVIVILTIASIWISLARQQAVRAKEAAVAAQHAEAEQRQLAEIARAKSQEEEQRAVKALADLEQAVKAMVAARSAEEQAKTKAQAAEMVATETRDELAKTGMLMDNSWWVFDAAAATTKQQEASTAGDLPVERTIVLPNDIALSLVLIPPGDFVMGSPPKEQNRAADEYLHRVHLTQPYYLGRFELTEAQWQAVMGEMPPVDGKPAEPDPLQPASGIPAEQITGQFLPALQTYAPEGFEFRLPTEAEWEYACRAGTPTAYYTGDDTDALDAAGWFVFNSERRVQQVGRKQPNAFGLYDMHGNVGELCRDLYEAGFYLESPTDDPLVTGDGERLVVRGGSVLNMSEHCRAAYRSYVYCKNKYEFIGVRVALVPKTEGAPQ